MFLVFTATQCCLPSLNSLTYLSDNQSRDIRYSCNFVSLVIRILLVVQISLVIYTSFIHHSFPQKFSYSLLWVILFLSNHSKSLLLASSTVNFDRWSLLMILFFLRHSESYRKMTVGLFENFLVQIRINVLYRFDCCNSHCFIFKS